jgi:hypothetical protein
MAQFNSGAKEPNGSHRHSTQRVASKRVMAMTHDAPGSFEGRMRFLRSWNLAQPMRLAAVHLPMRARIRDESTRGCVHCRGAEARRASARTQTTSKRGVHKDSAATNSALLCVSIATGETVAVWCSREHVG